MTDESGMSATGEIRLVRLEDKADQILVEIGKLVSLERYNIERDQLVKDIGRLEQAHNEHVRKTEQKDADRDRERRSRDWLIFASFLLPVAVVLLVRYITGEA